MERKYKKFLYKQLDDSNRMQTDHLDKQDFVKLFLGMYSKMVMYLSFTINIFFIDTHIIHHQSFLAKRCTQSLPILTVFIWQTLRQIMRCKNQGREVTRWRYSLSSGSLLILSLRYVLTPLPLLYVIICSQTDSICSLTTHRLPVDD